MTRLFLRFYLGVVAILIGAWLIQSYVFRERTESQNIRVVEQALSGGARLARDELANTPPHEATESFQRIQNQFDYPVRVFGLHADWLTEPSRNRLLNGEVVFLGSHIAIASQEQTSPSHAGSLGATEIDAGRGWGLLFGPLPRFVGPTQAEISFGYGIVFLLAAVAIAILLRPVASQLRAVERTAAAIAHGDLSARIESTQASKDLALVRAFNTMADRTETSLRSQRELLQAVSHELRTPLARIRFATDLVETAKSDEERRSRLDAIDNATQQLDDLVGELLTYVRLDSDAPANASEEIDVHALLDELIEIHASLNPSVQFVVEDASGPIRISAFRPGLARAIENLLSNAGRHAKERVCASVFQDNGKVVIQVDDDGDGIPSADREQIFEPFVSLDDDSSQRGTGLGLALVSRIAKRQGGHVHVGESPSGGARFSFVLPSA